MALKDTWRDLVDSTNGVDGDDVSVKPINDIAHAVIDLEEIDTEMSESSKNPVQNKVITLELNKKANTDEVFEEVDFGWTEYENSGVNPEYDVVTDNSISGLSTITIHCQGDTLGFSVESNGGIDNAIIVNGERIELTEGTPYVLPMTYMEEDFVVALNIGSCIFSNMKKRTLKGMGDVSEALGSIIAIQESHMGGDA